MFNNINNRERYILFVLIDISLLIISLLGSVFLRFDLTLPIKFVTSYTAWLPIILVIKLGLYMLFKLNKGMYRYTSLWDIANIEVDTPDLSPPQQVLISHSLSIVLDSRVFFI